MPQGLPKGACHDASNPAEWCCAVANQIQQCDYSWQTVQCCLKPSFESPEPTSPYLTWYCSTCDWTACYPCCAAEGRAPCRNHDLILMAHGLPFLSPEQAAARREDVTDIYLDENGQWRSEPFHPRRISGSVAPVILHRGCQHICQKTARKPRHMWEPVDASGGDRCAECLARS